MSKANAPRDPNCVTDCESLICNHCTPPSDRFVHSVVIVGLGVPPAGRRGNSKAGQASEDCAQRRSDDGGIAKMSKETNRFKAHMVERVINFGAGQIQDWATVQAPQLRWRRNG